MILKNKRKIEKIFLAFVIFCAVVFVYFYNKIDDHEKNINFIRFDNDSYNSVSFTIEDAFEVCLMFTHYFYLKCLYIMFE